MLRCRGEYKWPAFALGAIVGGLTGQVWLPFAGLGIDAAVRWQEGRAARKKREQDEIATREWLRRTTEREKLHPIVPWQERRRQRLAREAAGKV